MTKEEMLLAGLRLTKSGYAGINGKGTKVDRREYPQAKPLQKNSFLHIPRPKKVVIRHVCAKCNSEDVQGEGWIGYNDDKTEFSANHNIPEQNYCNDCDDNTMIVTVTKDEEGEYTTVKG